MAATPQIVDPKTHIFTRLQERSTSGFTKEEIVKLVKIVDSYHDFKVAKRVKGSGGDEAKAVAAALAFESPSASPKASSPKAASSVAGAHFQMILNNLFDQMFKPLTADTFFSTNGITKSSPEMSGRDFFERECGSALHASLGGPCIPIVVNCSEFVKPDFQMSSINSCGAIIVERDRAYVKNFDNNNTVGTKLLDWFFPSKTGTGNGVGFCFDAQSAMLKDFMKTLNNINDKYYCVQIVTPQNVLDSAGIGYDVLSTPGKEGELHKSGAKFTEKLSDGAVRTQYVIPTTNEFSNLFTEEFGKFSIQPKEVNTFNPDTMDFDWLFTPTGKSPLKMGKGAADDPADQSETPKEKAKIRNTGPGVPFLASMIDCVLTKDNHGELVPCLQSKAIANDRMVSPVPALGALDDTLQGDMKKYILRLIYDIKRLGDHEQANSVYFYNSNPKNTLTAIFVTGDTLSALYSRMLGNPTIYIKTEDENNPDSDKGSYLMCYRGIEKNIPADVKARMDVENTLSQLNYFFSKIGAFIDLARKNDLATLITNLETHKNAEPFTDNPELANMLFQAKIYNSLEFLHDIIGKLAPLPDTLEAQKKLLSLAGAKYENESFNVTLNADLTVEQLNKLNARLTRSMNALTPQMNLVMSDLQYLSNFKVVSKDGASVFSFHSTLFFSDSKLETKLDTINYKKEEVTNVVAAVMNFANRPVSSKLLEEKKDNIIKCCEAVLNSFFTTRGFDKSTWIKSLEEVVRPLGLENKSEITALILGLFEQIKELAIDGEETATRIAVKAAADAKVALETAIVEARNTAALGAAAAVAAAPAPKAAAAPKAVAAAPPSDAAVLAKEREEREAPKRQAAAAAAAAAADAKAKEAAAIKAAEAATAAKQAEQVKAAEAVADEKAEEAAKEVAAAVRKPRQKKEPVPSEPIKHSSRLQAKAEAAAALAAVQSPLVTPPKKRQDGGELKLLTTTNRTLTVNPNPENSIERVRQRVQEREGIPQDQQRLIFAGASPSVTRFRNLSDNILIVVLGLLQDFKDMIKLVPSSNVVDSQFYPYPEYIQDAPPQGGKRTRKQRKTGRRQSRKIGGVNQINQRDYTISNYDTSIQAQRAVDFFSSFVNYNNTLSGDDGPERRNMLRDKWYKFSSSLDAEGSPDVADIQNSYDIRMLRAFVDFPKNNDNLKATMSKEVIEPLGKLNQPLTDDEVKVLLHPEETKRIGNNNMIAYQKVIDQNEKELQDLPENDSNYDKNRALCNYMIALMQHNIENTEKLISLFGEKVIVNIYEKPNEENTYEPETISAQSAGRRRRTYKSRNRVNKNSRRM